MMPLSIFAVLAACLTLVQAVAVAQSDPEASFPHPFLPFTFEGVYKGNSFAVNGTSLPDVYSQLASVFPGFDPASVADPAESAVRTRANMTSNVYAGTYCCPVPGQSWTPSSVAYIRDCQTSLRFTGGRIGIQAHSCARLACSHGGGVNFCNNNNFQFNPALADVAIITQDIMDNCGEVACGQLFDTEGFNVIIVHIC